MSNWDALIGRTFGGRFSLTALLAEGASGAVFRGVDADEPREVAVKILSPEFDDDPARRARFAHEARLAARIEHPNTPRVLDHGTQGSVSYLVMELVEGRELFDVLVEAGRLSPARGASIVLQVCDILAAAHDLDIIHRDLKPENVMLTGDAASPEGERVKLLDFGVAKRIGSMPDEDLENITVIGTILGTPGYMAPEQCLGTTVDVRSDVYACGALLYHLLTGRPLFEDPNPFITLQRQINEPPRPPSAMVPGLDPALEATILKALAKRPEDRHQSVIELWEELLAELPRLSRTMDAVAVRAPEPARRAAEIELRGERDRVPRPRAVPRPRSVFPVA
jgi:eukaryotic-like serine/threonine-protein kinase